MALLAIGVLLRLAQYLSNPSLWMDEAFLALNISHKPLSELTDPLSNRQAAPLGFLFAEKAVVEAAGTSEYAFRFVPLVSALASVFLFFLVARRWLQRQGLPIALALFAVTTPLIIYAAQAKQYSVDVTAALLVYLGAIWMRRAPLSITRAAAFGLLGAALVWLSYSVVFVLAAVTFAVAFTAIVQREWKTVATISLASMLWAASFGISYLASQDQITGVSEQLGSGAAIESVQTGEEQAVFTLRDDPGVFVPLPPSPSTLKWLGEKSSEVVHDSLGSHRTLTGVLAVVLLVGAVSLFRRARELALILILPLALVLIASSMKLYPIGGRFVLFLVPAVLLILAEGTIATLRATRGRESLLGILLAAVVVIPPVASAAENATDPWTRQELRPLLTHLRGHHREEDGLYIHYSAQYAFRYYWERGFVEPRSGRTAQWRLVPAASGTAQYAQALESSPPLLVVGKYDPSFRRYVNELEMLRGNDRVWVVILHFAGSPFDEQGLLVRYLDAIGVRREEVHEVGISLLLYDLS